MLNKNQVKHIAKLANLKLTSVEINRFKKQLSEVLEYIEQLNELNTKKIQPTSQVTGLENVFREDKSKPSLSQKEVLSGGKNTEKGMFKIKAIFEEIT